MFNWMVKFEKPSGELARIHREYLDGRNILNLYTSEELRNWERVDLYLLLDLDMYRAQSIPPHVLSHVARVKMCEYHPDVTKGCKEAFLLVKVARDVFGNQKLRLLYDSGFFDESIPEDRIYLPDEFFRVFGKCFERNAKFSIKQPVPLLNPVDDLRKTEEFYEFWSKFRSWRVFESAEEFYKMNEDERGQYSIKNKEKLNQLRNLDILRIKKLVQIAKKRDPRVGKSIEEQMADMDIKSWTPDEESGLRRLISLFGKSRKSDKWEIIAEKLSEMTRVKRSVSEVMKRGLEIEKR